MGSGHDPGDPTGGEHRADPADVTPDRDIDGLALSPNGKLLAFVGVDSRRLGFLQDGALKVVDVESGLIEVVADNAFPSGASWSRHGEILFTGQGRQIAVRARALALALSVSSLYGERLYLGTGLQAASSTGLTLVSPG